MNKKRILMINSSEALMEFSKKLLERAGYDVHCVEGVRKANERLMDFRPDCIIIDRELADGNAFDFCREFKKESGVPILFISYDKDDELAALESGSDDFLKRPVDYNVYKARVGILLNARVESTDRDGTGKNESAATMSGAPEIHEWAQGEPEEEPGQETGQETGQGQTENTQETFEPAQEHKERAPVNNKTTRAKKQIHLYMTIAACVVLMIAGVVILYNQGNRLPDTEITDLGVPLGIFPMIDENARPYLGEAVETVKGPDYLLPCYERIIVEAGTPDIKITLLNPEGNTRYFTFEIVLKDENESFYKSGLVEPGMCVDSITPERALQKGEYKAALVIRVYEKESLSEITGATVDFIFVVM